MNFYSTKILLALHFSKMAIALCDAIIALVSDVCKSFAKHSQHHKVYKLEWHTLFDEKRKQTIRGKQKNKTNKRGKNEKNFKKRQTDKQQQISIFVDNQRK